ncbi:MAG TPA: hypothetical protein ENN47_09445 [Mesotoga infera]|uniref:Alcohol dehydrogenase-like N-terminal domain-containing protein n=1 Tax=Mesotoga infera TaxID=1236046 RepID=A0A7C1H759_9BACT|nr:hypothetical protein [Mesotoga infera]
MKAVMYEGIGKLSIREVEKPKIEEDGILVKIMYSFICSTDIKTFKQGHPMIKPPTILGHECSGRIVEVGSKVEGFEVGDCVAVAPFVNCGECEQCIGGNPEGCRNRSFPSNGAMTEFLSVDMSYASKGVWKVSESQIREAALAEPMACALTSCRNMKLQPGESVLVVGAGIMGMLNATALRDIYGQIVKIVDTREDRLKLAEEMGFSTSLEASGKFNSIVLTAPIPELIDKYLPMVKLFGNLVLFGGYPKGIKASFDPNIIHYNGIRMTGTTGFAPKDFAAAIALMNSGQLLLTPFTNRIYEFSDFEEAFNDAVEGRSIKVGIKVGE